MSTIKVPETLFRAATIERAMNADGVEETQLSISSDTPYKRYDWWNEKEYWEVLDHSPEAVDMSRAKNGLAFLDTHDMRKIIGRVEGIGLEKKKLRGVARFSRST